MNKTTFKRLIVQAAHHQLGEPLAFIVHPPQPISRLGILATFVGLVLIVVLALLAPVLIVLLPLWQVVLVLLVAVCWIATGSWLQLSSWMGRKGIETLLCTNGIVWSHQRSPEAIRWQEIESLWRKMTRDSARRYEIWLRDGRIVTLDSRVLGAEKLARFVERVVISRHLASLLQEYHRGITLKFGPLCVSHCGLQVPQHREALAWHQVKHIDNSKHILVIRQKEHIEDWATFDVSSIPNVCILEALVRYVHRMHKASAASERHFLPKRPLSIRTHVQEFIKR